MVLASYSVQPILLYDLPLTVQAAGYGLYACFSVVFTARVHNKETEEEHKNGGE